MPQLDKVTFVSQVFWLILVLITLYLCMLHFILPYIGRTLKFRKRLIDTYLYDSLKFRDLAISAIDRYKSVLHKSLSVSNRFVGSFFRIKRNYFSIYNRYLGFQIDDISVKFSEELTSIYIKKSLLLELKKRSQVVPFEIQSNNN